MKKLKAWLEPKYTKIAIYAIVSAVIVFICCLLAYNSHEALSRFFSLLSSIVWPLILGLVIAYLLLPLVQRLEGSLFKGLKTKRLRRNMSVLLIYVIVAAAIVVALIILIVSITRTISNIHFSTSDLEDLAAYLHNEFADFWDYVDRKLTEFNVNLGSVGKKAASMFNNAKSAGSTLLFSGIFSIYFLMDSGIGRYWRKVSRTLLTDRTRAGAREFLKDADRVFSGYIRGQALDALIMCAMVTISFLIADIPYAAVIGIMTGIGNLIPFVGPIVGFGSLTIACLATGSYFKFLIGIAILIVVLAVDGNLINPKLLSDSVEIHPILVFLALIAGGQVGGLIGMLVAVPCAALIKQQFEKYVDHKAKEKAAESGENPNTPEHTKGIPHADHQEIKRTNP